MDFVFVGFRGKFVRRSFSHILGVDSFSLFVPLNNFEKDLNLDFFFASENAVTSRTTWNPEIMMETTSVSSKS